MNINYSNVNVNVQCTKSTTSTSSNNSSVKFSDELKELEKNTKNESVESAKEENTESEVVTDETVSNENELTNAVESLSSVVIEIHQSDEKVQEALKDTLKPVDIIEKGDELINNDFSIQENKDIIPQMSMNMGFNGDGQPFSSFMNNDDKSAEAKGLSMSAKELAEEAEILSTMSENIAMANKNTILASIAKTSSNEIGIKSNSIIMNQTDVQFFADLVLKGELNLNDYSSQTLEKASRVSKTLADMLVNSMEKNQPLRIDFDNDISVIIRISRDGKISADFLPSSQIAEAYLKENLPLLKQRFEENNIEYDELNHRGSKQKDKDERKKGRNDE